MYSWSLY